MDKQKEEGKLFKCVKCKKEKKEDEGSHVLEGTTFCCKQCCDTTREKDEEGKDKMVCEFC